MNIAICDDERAQLDALENAIIKCKLSGWKPERIARFTSGEALLRAVSDGEDFSFIFLDIQMPGIGGLRAYERLIPLTAARVVFVSTHTEALPEVFALSKPCFLHKPYTQNTFDRTIQSVFFQADEHMFHFEEDGVTRGLPCSKIRYIRSEGHYLKIFEEAQAGFFRARLDDVEAELEPHGFFRCHRSYLINLRFFKKRDAKNAYLKSAAVNGGGETMIPVGKSKIRGLDAAFMRRVTGERAWLQ